MDVDLIKEELNKLPLEILEPLFNEMLTKKKNQEREKQLYNVNIVKLYNVLSNFSNVANYYKRRMSLFDSIGCNSEGLRVVSMIDGLIIAQLLNVKTVAHMRRKAQSIEETSEFQAELKASYARIGAKAYESQNQQVVGNKLLDYHSELERYCTKFGKRITEPKFFNIFINGLKAKEILPYSKGKYEVLADIKRIVSEKKEKNYE